MRRVNLKTWHFLLVFVILVVSSNIIWCSELSKTSMEGYHSSLVELDDRMFSDSIVSGTCFVLFHTQSDVCYKMEQNLSQLNNTSDGNIRMFKLNIEAYPGEYGKYAISGTPTTIVFKDGQEIDRIMGIVPISNLLMIYKRSM